MKAIAYQQAHALTDHSNWQSVDLPMPVAREHDVLIEVQAVSVNPVDCKIRQAVSAPEGEWKVLGWDASGIVTAVGDKVSLFKPGDRVWYAGDLSRPGSNAEYQLVDEHLVGHMPASLTFVEAAALPLTSITAWEMLFDRLQIAQSVTCDIHQGSKTLLIIGAAGGVGSIMTQLAKQLTDVTVIATASRSESRQWLQQLGADHIIDHRQPLAPQLSRIGVTAVDYVVSLNQTDQHLSDIVEVIAPQGKFGLIDDPAELNALPFKRKSVSLHWELMFTRSLYQTDDKIQQHHLLTKVAALVDEGRIRTTMTQDFGLLTVDNLRRAHALLESQQSRGKIVLQVRA